MLEKVEKNTIPPDSLFIFVKEKIQSLLKLQKQLNEISFSGENTLEADEIKKNEDLKQYMENFDYIRIQKVFALNNFLFYILKEKTRFNKIKLDNKKRISRILLLAKNKEISDKDLAYEKLNADTHCFIEGEKIKEKKIFYKLIFYKKNREKQFAILNEKFELVKNVTFWHFVY
jgi:hypothetical protein